jgi:hypothetical protein
MCRLRHDVSVMADENASVFGAVLLGAFLVPWTLLKLRALRGGQPLVRVPLGAGEYAAAVLRKEARLRGERLRGSFSLSNAVFVALWCAMASTCASVRRTTSTLPSLPHEVLGIAEGAPREEVRAAFRRLSLQFHPDKAGADPHAKRRFLEVTQAHAILTDPVARENYERYGNPDGYRGMTVDFGLPKWIVGDGGRDGGGGGGAAVALAALALVIAVPLLAVRAMSPSARERERRDMQSALVQGHGAALATRALSVAELVDAAASALCALTPVRATLARADVGEAVDEVLARLPAVLRERLAKLPDPLVGRAAALLHARAARLQACSDRALASALVGASDLICARLPLLGECLVAVALALTPTAEATGTKPPSGVPAASRVEALVLGAQRLVQALPAGVAAPHSAAGGGGGSGALSLEPLSVLKPAGDSALAQLLQLPHVDIARARALMAASAPAAESAEGAARPAGASGARGSAKKRNNKKGAGAQEGVDAAGKLGDGESTVGGAIGADDAAAATVARPAAGGGALSSLRALCRAEPAAARLALEACGLDGAQASDALAFCAAFPTPSLSLECEVLDEERVECGDLVTVRARLRAPGRAPPAPAGARLAHAPHVGAAVCEQFQLLLTAPPPLAKRGAGGAGGARLHAPKLVSLARAADGCEHASSEWMLRVRARARRARAHVRARMDDANLRARCTAPSPRFCAGPRERRAVGARGARALHRLRGRGHVRLGRHPGARPTARARRRRRRRVGRRVRRGVREKPGRRPRLGLGVLVQSNVAVAEVLRSSSQQSSTTTYESDSVTCDTTQRNRLRPSRLT